MLDPLLESIEGSIVSDFNRCFRTRRYIRGWRESKNAFFRLREVVSKVKNI